MRFAAIALAAFATHAGATTLAEKAKESGCVGKPKQVEGSMYKCETRSGAFSYFNVPDQTGPTSTAPVPSRTPAPAGSNGSGSRPSASGFPRIDAETQKGRDDMRKRVLRDELATEEKLLAEARTAYADGAPAPLAEERTNADKYRERIARLRQAVVLHERNVEALRKEVAALR